MKIFLMTLVTLCLVMAVSCITETTLTSPTKYEGPQTVEALLENFREKVGTNPEVDEKYPQAKWLQMLLEKGVTIENDRDYSRCMSMRWRLVFLEHQPKEWGSGKFGIPPTDDWETYKTAYIDRKIWEYQQFKAAKQVDPSVSDILFVGPDQKTIIPLPNKAVCVSRAQGGGSVTGGGLSNQQVFDILFKGKHPRGWKIIYIDEAGNILPEKPAPVSREELGLPEDVPWPPKNQEHLDRIYNEVRHSKMLEDNR